MKKRDIILADLNCPHCNIKLNTYKKNEFLHNCDFMRDTGRLYESFVILHFINQEINLKISFSNNNYYIQINYYCNNRDLYNIALNDYISKDYYQPYNILLCREVQVIINKIYKVYQNLLFI